MKFFSGFCLQGEKELFTDFLDESEFCVAGFSYGAQKALKYVLTSSERIDKLQLLSPAFFDYGEKLIKINLKAFKKNKKYYKENFFKKAGFYNEKYITDCRFEELMELFTFDWEIIKNVKDVKIEVFIGEYDKIIASKKAYDFFKKYAEVILIKKADHFLRS